VRIRRKTRKEPRLEAAAWTVLVENGVRIRRWSRPGEGYAYATGGARVIDAPRPRTPGAFAILCHEVAHHALGHTAHAEPVDARRELEEEWAAWEFTFACFARFELTVPAAVSRDVAASMAERLAAALEEGLDPVPPRFQPFEPGARTLLAAPRSPGYNESSGEISLPRAPP
jgi:hypothetical protein